MKSGFYMRAPELFYEKTVENYAKRQCSVQEKKGFSPPIVVLISWPG